MAPGQDWLGGLAGSALLAVSKLHGQSKAAEYMRAVPSPHRTGVLRGGTRGVGASADGSGPQRGLMEPQVPVEPHSQPMPETEETTRGVGPGPPSWGHGAWSSLRKATPLTRGHWTRPPHSACLSSWAAAGRPAGLVGRAGGHRHHTFGCLVLSESIESGSFQSTDMSNSTEQMQMFLRPASALWASLPPLNPRGQAPGAHGSFFSRSWSSSS